MTQVSGIPLALDGDLLRYDHGEPADEPGSTELADPRAGAAPRPERRGDPPRSRAAARRRASSRPRLYVRVFALADQLTGKPAPRAVLPQIPLHSPKITRNLTTDWFANRVETSLPDLPRAASET